MIADTRENGETSRHCEKFQEFKEFMYGWEPKPRKGECVESTYYEDGAKGTFCTCSTDLCNNASLAKGGIVGIITLLAIVMLTL